MIVPSNFCASCRSPTNRPAIISLSCQLTAISLRSLTGERTLRQPRAMNLPRLHIEGRWFVDEHRRRVILRGVNRLRLLTTWEAVEHRGPNDYDVAYLDYFAELCRLAGDYGFYVFVDFHQDVWSRMSGGDGAPGWLFEKVGIDYRRI